MRTSRAKAVLASLVLVLVGTVTACGGGDDADQADDQSTASESPETTAGETEEPSDDGAEPAAGGADLTADNLAVSLVEAQAEAGSVHVSGAFGAGGQSLSMTGDMRTGDPDELAMDVQLDIPQLGSGVRMILVDQTVYMNLGQATGNKYARIDLSDPSEPLAQQFGPLLDSADPGRSIAALAEGLEKLDKIGEDRVDGVATTHYRATVDTEAALAASGVSDTMPSQTAAQLPKTFAYDLWVGDDDGLIRRLSFDLLGQTSTLTFTGWGEPVQIEAPSPDEIAKAGGFAG